MNITLGEALKRRLMDGTALKRDEKGLYLDWDTLVIGPHRTEFKQGEEVVGSMSYDSGVPSLLTFTLTDLEGRMRVVVD